MLCLKNCRRTGFGTFLSVFFFLSFFLSFLNIHNTFATTVSIPFSDIQVCSSDCSDYSFLLVNFDFPPSSSYTYYSQVYINGSSILRFNFLPNQFYNINQDFYIPIPSSASSVSISSPNSNSGSLTYELLTSLSSGITPSGSITLTQNGTYDVTNYAEAVVDVPPLVEPGDYHDDLISIQQAIYVCGAILLVLYFFYCIYRIIIKTTGSYL